MRVVHCKREPFTHYIGRPHADFPGRAIGLGNPFPVQIGREKCIAQYEQWARTNPRIKALIVSLPEDAVLGCWCAPKPCHGDVIVKLWEEWR